MFALMKKKVGLVASDNGRELYVDIIKGWAILTIIIFHCTQSCITGVWGQFLGNAWNVVLFFIVGGFYLKEEALNKPLIFLKGKFRRLYIPATIIYALSVLLHNIFVKIGWYQIGRIHPATRVPFEYFGIKEIGIGLVKVFAAGGSGELAMGAMWFIYSLLYAFVGMSILYWLLNVIFKKKNLFIYMTISLMFLASLSCILSQKYAFTISRFSVAVTAMFLIWWGMIINKKWKWEYNKWWGFFIAIVVFTHCVLMQRGSMALARNEYQDLVQVVVGGTSLIYVLGFIGKKISNLLIGKILAFLGRESLYLMAFHIVGFFICNSILLKLGIFSFDDEKGLYTYNIGSNYLLLVVYVIVAIITSLGILFAYRYIKGLLICLIKDKNI